jgi:hypothetical protein
MPVNAVMPNPMMIAFFIKKEWLMVYEQVELERLRLLVAPFRRRREIQAAENCRTNIGKGGSSYLQKVGFSNGGIPGRPALPAH